MEHEVNGLDYRYVYGNERLSVNISPIENGAGSVVESGTVGQQIRLYYHQDLRGTVDYLTSPVSQKVESWTHYNEWGEITHNAVLKMGQRELDLVKNYTGHDFDAVLNMYYAKARMYDAENRRFVSIDPILDGTKYDLSDYTTKAITFSAYLYVQDNPLRWVDPLGLEPLRVTGNGVRIRSENNADNKQNILGLLYKGDIVNSLGSWQPGKTNWTYVDTGKLKGYVSNQYLESATTKVKSGEQYTVTSRRLSLRKWPSNNAASVKILDGGASVTTLGEECTNGDKVWTKVKDSSGNQGWVVKQYLNLKPTTVDVPAFPTIDSIDNVISMLDELEKKAGEYLNTTDKVKISLTAMNFIRQFNYADGNWPDIAGPVNQGFIDYVKGSDVYKYFETLTCVSGVNSDANLDIRHFAATLSAMCFTTASPVGRASWPSKLKALGVGENSIDELAGWAGDLQTLLQGDIIPKLGKAASYQDVYDMTKSLLQNTDPNSSFFSKVDLIADIDAVNLTQLMSSRKSFAEAMREYYITGEVISTKNRYRSFEVKLSSIAKNSTPMESVLNSKSKDVVKDYVRQYTKLKFLHAVAWPLYDELDDIPGNVTRGVADAFVDLIWELAGKE